MLLLDIDIRVATFTNCRISDEYGIGGQSLPFDLDQRHSSRNPRLQGRIPPGFPQDIPSPNYLYLVGDIIDCWRLRRAWYWQQSHNDVVQKLLRKARKGTHVVYIPGNHDEPLRDYTEMQFGGVTVQEEAIHVTADGRRLLILHGDKFDGIVQIRPLARHPGRPRLHHDRSRSITGTIWRAACSA